jgi:uncharacterized protein DUF3306
MSSEPESFIARWSRRKRAADAKPSLEKAAPDAAPAKVTESLTPAPASGATRESVATTQVPLPPIESLDGLRSDYEAFFQQPVAEELRHAALKKLLADPHFNQMDMLDVYVDDYTQFEPLPAALRVRLPSARSFLSDSERAELEAAEAQADAASDVTETAVTDPAPIGNAGAASGVEKQGDAEDAAVAASTSGPSATAAAAPANIDARDEPQDSASRPRPSGI